MLSWEADIARGGLYAVLGCGYCKGGAKCCLGMRILQGEDYMLSWDADIARGG